MKAKKVPVVVIDSDAIVAQANKDDSNHQKALKVTQRLASLGSKDIYPVTAVCEAVTVLSKKLSSKKAAWGIASVFAEPQIEVVEVNKDIYARALNNYFDPKASKKNTIFDCIVATVADEYGADAIFSFDKFYKKRGFKLASELYPKTNSS